MAITYEKVIERLKVYNSDYKLLTSKEEWKNMTTKVSLQHINCPNPSEEDGSTVWEETMSHILNDKRICPQCKSLLNKDKTDRLGRKLGPGKKGYTNDEFKAKVLQMYPNKEYELLSDYVNDKTHIRVRHNCKECNYHEFTVRPSHFTSGSQCPICSKNKVSKIMKEKMLEEAKTHEEFIQQVYDKVGLEYTVLGIYKNCKTPIKVRHNCKECGYHEYNVRPRDFLTKGNRCNVCAKRMSKQEIEVRDFIKSFYDKEIITNNRDLIGKEIDMYFPDLNLAIEYDGLFFHSDYRKDKRYHLNKTIACEEKGIQLIHLFSDEWMFKQDIVKSKLKHIMGCDDSPKIYARNCEIREITDKKLKREFLDKNHIQGGWDQSILAFGLYHNDELVSIMTIGYENHFRTGGKKNKSKEDENKVILEIKRYANDINYRVIGGFSKLLKYFINNYEFDELITYADRRWSKKNNVYSENNNFVFDSETAISPHYIEQGKHEKRLNRSKYTRAKLWEMYPEYKAQELSESQIMLEKLHYLRIWDCGNLKYVMKNKTEEGTN